MRSLAAIFCALWLGVVGRAHAADEASVAVLYPAAAPSGEWELVVGDAAGHPWAGVPTMSVGAREALLEPAGPGRWRVDLAGPDRTGVLASDPTIEVRAGRRVEVTRLLVSPRAPGALAGAPDVEVSPGAAVAILRFPVDPTAGEGLRSDDLTVATSEGRVREVRVEDGAVVVEVALEAARAARVVAVGVLDGRRPGERPVFGVVRVRGRPQLTLVAEPGTVATLRVGRRSFGPFKADRSGTVTVTFETTPGDAAYELTLSDDLGNTQRSTGPLGVGGGPLLVAIPAPGGPAGADAAWLAAWTPVGAPWSTTAPQCRGTPSRPIASVGPGLWRIERLAASRGSSFDTQFDCALDGATAQARVAAHAVWPDRLDLDVYPEVLDADFPLAQARASLYSSDGARLPPDGVVVRARLGEVAATVRDDVVHVEYRGTAAVAAGADTLEAVWTAPPGEGEPWAITLLAEPSAAATQARVRVLDDRGRPLPEVDVRVEALDARGGVLGDEVARTDGNGWAGVRLDGTAPLVMVRATAGVASRTVPAFRDHPPSSWSAGDTDLSAVVVVPIHAGRVRTAYIDASPRPLLTGTGATATVLVRLLDANGALVRDEPPRISADAGSVGPPSAREDGAWVATYTPPPGVGARAVRLSATAGASTVATDLLLEPRPVRGSAGLTGGWITNFEGISSPTFGVTVTQSVPGLPEAVAARVSVAGHVARATVTDETGVADVTATLVPVELGAVIAQRFGRRAVSAGVGAVLTPYHLRARFDGVTAVDSLALAPVGVAVHASAGWRVGGAEVYAEAGWLVLPSDDAPVRFDASLGGGSLVAGYRLLW